MRPKLIILMHIAPLNLVLYALLLVCMFSMSKRIQHYLVDKMKYARKELTKAELSRCKSAFLQLTDLIHLLYLAPQLCN
jgi:hypothetical protein